MEFIEDQAVIFFGNEVLTSKNLSWNICKDMFIARYAHSHTSPVIEANQRSLNKGETIRHYYDDKMIILRRSVGMASSDMVDHLTIGLPERYRTHFYGKQFTSTHDWLQCAQDIEADLNRQDSQPHGSSHFTNRKQTQAKPNKKWFQAKKSKPKPVDLRKPLFFCKFCKEFGIHILHWHNECPNNPINQKNPNAVNATKVKAVTNGSTSMANTPKHSFSHVHRSAPALTSTETRDHTLATTTALASTTEPSQASASPPDTKNDHSPHLGSAHHTTNHTNHSTQSMPSLTQVLSTTEELQHSNIINAPIVSMSVCQPIPTAVNTAQQVQELLAKGSMRACKSPLAAAATLAGTTDPWRRSNALNPPYDLKLDKNNQDLNHINSSEVTTDTTATDDHTQEIKCLEGQGNDHYPASTNSPESNQPRPLDQSIDLKNLANQTPINHKPCLHFGSSHTWNEDNPNQAIIIAQGFKPFHLTRKRTKIKQSSLLDHEHRCSLRSFKVSSPTGISLVRGSERER